MLLQSSKQRCTCFHKFRGLDSCLMPCNIVGKIVQSTVQECQETSAIWINHVLILLLTQVIKSMVYFGWNVY
jgi:hypothetical protein